MTNAIVDTGLCSGCGICETICPSVFVMDGGVATVHVAQITAKMEESCRLAVEQCPAKAILMAEVHALMLAKGAGAAHRWIAL